MGYDAKVTRGCYNYPGDSKDATGGQKFENGGNYGNKDNRDGLTVRNSSDSGKKDTEEY